MPNVYSDQRATGNAVFDSQLFSGSPSGTGVFVKIAGSYILGDSVHIKVGGAYKLVDELYIKQSDAYSLI